MGGTSRLHPTRKPGHAAVDESCLLCSFVNDYRMPKDRPLLKFHCALVLDRDIDFEEVTLCIFGKETSCETSDSRD